MSSSDPVTEPQAPTSGAAPGDPTTPTPPPVKRTERPHPLTPFIRGWIVLVAIVVYAFRDFMPGRDGDGFSSLSLWWILTGVATIVLLAAAAGFLSWYFTHFVIDDEELRIETGWLFRNSRKVPFERLQSVDIVQPLAARIFGLAELRLEVGAGDSTLRLRYLKRAQADRLRDYLITRAHGVRASVGDGGQQPGASAITDLSARDVPLVTVGPQRLIGSFLLSSEWIAAVFGLVVVMIVTFGFGVGAYALPGIIPLAFGVVSLISARLIGLFNFTLAESPRGLRVTRGLTNLTSQSIPAGRVQGIKISQSILWRRFDWYRVDVNVLGVGQSSSSEDNEKSATSVLLPVADPAEVTRTLTHLLPGLDLSGIELHPSPRSARWLRWFDFWTLRYGWNERVVITEHGWLTHVRNVIPHAKTQSVRLAQGPLQRRLGLADVHFDLTPGPVASIAHQIDAEVARELTLTELDRAREARAIERDQPPAAARDTSTDQVLARFGIGRDALIGSGGESEVYGLDAGLVLRLYRSSHESPEPVIHQLRHLYAGWATARVPFQVPQIVDAGSIAGRWSTVDRRMAGESLSGWLRTASPEERRVALTSYLDVALAVQNLPAPVPGFARLVGAGAPETYDTLDDLLTHQLQGPLSRSQARLETDAPGAPAAWDRMQDALEDRRCEPRVVHGDFCPPNAFVSRGPGGAPVVSGVGDFSPHTLCADPLMDVAGAVAFVELESYDGASEDAAWLAEQAIARLGGDMARWLSVYRTFYGFYFSDTFASEPATYAWCLRQLG